VLVTVGASTIQPTIRNGLAMGADSAVLLTASDADPLQAARALAAELKDKGYDLILCGKQAVDDDSAQVGPMLAELLGVPCATVVTKLELDGDAAGASVKAEREIEGGLEQLAFKLPAVVTCQKGLNEPRFPSLKG